MPKNIEVRYEDGLLFLCTFVHFVRLSCQISNAGIEHVHAKPHLSAAEVPEHSGDQRGGSTYSHYSTSGIIRCRLLQQRLPGFQSLLVTKEGGQPTPFTLPQVNSCKLLQQGLLGFQTLLETREECQPTPFTVPQVNSAVNGFSRGCWDSRAF
jgi:hypothetical protein